MFGVLAKARICLVMKKILPVLLLAITVCGAASDPQYPSANNETQQTEVAFFAGGCFWCVEADFEKLPGVIEVVSGYTGGHTKNPTYKQVTRGGTGHYEATKTIYDPRQISYRQLVDYFWMTIDPTDAGGQFCDRGDSYRAAVFATPEQLEAARASKSELDALKPFSADIVTPVLDAAPFYEAESDHQNYYRKNKLRYKFYRNGCGRDKRLKALWGEKKS